MTTKENLLSDVEAIQAALEQRDLSPGELEELSSLIENIKKKVEAKSPPVLSFRDLKGLGKELWQDIDVDEYIREERRSWR